MSKLQDIPMPASVANEVKDLFYEIRLILNNGRYQAAVYSVAPTAADTGQEGELRLVVEGSDYRLYWHDGTSWYKSYIFTKVA